MEFVNVGIQALVKFDGNAASRDTEHSEAACQTDETTSGCVDDVLTKEPRKKRRKIAEDDQETRLHLPSSSVCCKVVCMLNRAFFLLTANYSLRQPVVAGTPPPLRNGRFC